MDAMDPDQDAPHSMSIMRTATDTKEEDRMSLLLSSSRDSNIDELKQNEAKQILNYHAK